ncbi:MAG: hypothetical protein JWQ66_1741 [Mucilaginibacter sp.]|jgi:hypothetical protein|nr:hypothetical protein [Mucilaginibacter sp.]
MVTIIKISGVAQTTIPTIVDEFMALFLVFLKYYASINTISIPF